MRSLTRSNLRCILRVVESIRKKSGYKAKALHFDENGAVTEKLFITGFEQDDDVIGRPVDVVESLE